MQFCRQVDGFNSRCEVAGGTFLSLKWSTHQMVDHINTHLLPASGQWRAEFFSARDTMLQTKPLEKWKLSDIRILLAQVERRNRYLRKNKDNVFVQSQRLKGSWSKQEEDNQHQEPRSKN